MRAGVYGIFRSDICLYVGKAMNLLRRRRDHETGRKSNKLLQEQIFTHGVRAFRWEVLEECPADETYLRAAESVWITALQPICNLQPVDSSYVPRPINVRAQEWIERFGMYRRMFPTAQETS